MRQRWQMSGWVRKEPSWWKWHRSLAPDPLPHAIPFFSFGLCSLPAVALGGRPGTHQSKLHSGGAAWLRSPEAARGPSRAWKATGSSPDRPRGGRRSSARAFPGAPPRPPGLAGRLSRRHLRLQPAPRPRPTGHRGRGGQARPASSSHPPRCLRAFCCLFSQTKRKRPRRCLHSPLGPRKPSRPVFGASARGAAAAQKLESGPSLSGLRWGLESHAESASQAFIWLPSKAAPWDPAFPDVQVTLPYVGPEKNNSPRPFTNVPFPTWPTNLGV